MPMEEMIVALMDSFIGEVAKEGIVTKIKLAETLIPLLYAYLRELGVSDEEINSFYDKEAAE